MRNDNYEQILKNEGVDFTYLPRLEVKAIDQQAGLKNQARLKTPILESRIERYAEMRKDGLEPPAIVVYRRKNLPIWVPIDGNQRIAAAKKCNDTIMDAYQVNCEDQMILDRLTWSFNNMVNGEPVDEEESIEHAVTMIQKYGLAQEDMAKQYGVSKRAIQKRILTGKLRDVLRSRGAAPACGLSDEKIEVLNPFVELGEEVFAKAATVTHKCGLTLDDIDEMRKGVKRAKTYEEKVRAVANFENSATAIQRRAETKGGTVHAKAQGRQPCEQLHYLLKKIDNLLNEYDKPALRRKGVGYKETHELAREVSDKLILVFGLGARLNGTTPEKVGV